MRKSIAIAVIGVGSWGDAVCRALDATAGVSLVVVCDAKPERALRLRRFYPEAAVTTALDDVLGDETIDAVVLGMSPRERRGIALRALEADKHVLVRGPLAETGDEADELVAVARKRGRRLLTGGGLLHHPAIAFLRRLVEAGELGDLYYVHGQRQCPGASDNDGDVLRDLGIDELGAILTVLGDEPIAVSVHGDAYRDSLRRDVVDCYLEFATGIAAYLHLSRLGHRSLRCLTAVGARRTAVFDALDAAAPVKIYAGRDDPFAAHAEAATMLALSLTERKGPGRDVEAFVAALRAEGDALAAARRAACALALVDTLAEVAAPAPLGELDLPGEPRTQLVRLPSRPSNHA